MYVGTQGAARAQQAVVVSSGWVLAPPHARAQHLSLIPLQSMCGAGRACPLLPGTGHLLPAALGNFPAGPGPISQRRVSIWGEGDSGNFSVEQGGLPGGMRGTSLGWPGCHHFKRQEEAPRAPPHWAWNGVGGQCVGTWIRERSGSGAASSWPES